MSKMFSIVATCLSATLLSGSALGADRGTEAEAVAMVNRAAALIKSAGKEKAFAAIADPQNKDFHYKDLYVYVTDFNGVSLAHGTIPKMVGKNLLELKDQDGKSLIKEMVAVARSPAGKGWVDFKWPNPVTKAVELKSGYVLRVDDFFVGSGIYK